MSNMPTHYLTVKDYSVSKESFDLFHDQQLDLLYTSPQPSAEALPAYYDSEDYISHTDSKRTYFDRIYQVIKEIAIKGKVDLLDRLQPSKGKLLDIGAGTGDFLSAAANKEWDITGIEPSEKARKIAQDKGVPFVADTDSLQAETFDAISMWHVLEHVPDINKQFAALNRLIKPTGTILIAVPNFKSYDAKHYGKFWAAYDVPRHLWHFSKESIQRLAAQNNMELVDVKPMYFDAFYVSLLSEKYKTGKMRILWAFWIGLSSNWLGMFSKQFSSHIYVLRSLKSENK